MKEVIHPTPEETCTGLFLAILFLLLTGLVCLAWLLPAGTLLLGYLLAVLVLYVLEIGPWSDW